MSQAITGTFGATGQSAALLVDGVNDLIARTFNISLWGTFVATVRLERSFDSGTTWLPITSGGSAAYQWTAPASESKSETEVGVLYRLNCTAWTSGTVNYRLSE